jgi:hypothetical protein
MLWMKHQAWELFSFQVTDFVKLGPDNWVIKAATLISKIPSLQVTAILWGANIVWLLQKEGFGNVLQNPKIGII